MENGITIGMDVSDKKVDLCLLNEAGEVAQELRRANNPRSLEAFFSKQAPCVVVLEAGTHSRWQAELIERCGHKVFTANPRRVRAIWAHERKSDLRDAQMLARIGRFDPNLLSPIHHRSAQAHRDLERIKARDQLVSCRRRLISHVRGAVKIHGLRLGSCSPEAFPKRAKAALEADLLDTLWPLLESIEQLNLRIHHYDRQIEALRDFYPVIERLCAITGVGTLSAAAFVLRLEDPGRFSDSRQVGAFLGLAPGRDQSGSDDKKLPITKTGDPLVRRLLVNCAQYILGAFGPDCDLRRYGLRLEQRGGAHAKKRAVVAVARKLAVLMHTLWLNEADYQPNYAKQIHKAA